MPKKHFFTFKSSFLLGGFFLLIFVFLANNAQATVTWTETRPAGDLNQNWQAIASDSTGLNLVAAIYGGRLYTSANGGTSWTERRPAGDFDQNWQSVASDSSGSNLIAAVMGGRIYTSNDGGGTWVEKQPVGNVNRNWEIVASDADGSNLIATVFNGLVYTSSNHGDNWIETKPTGSSDNKYWDSVASDADGSNLIIAVYGGRLYTSSNGGTNWTERRPAGNFSKNWYSVASDDDGSNLIAVAYPGRVYTSSDGGASWVERRPAGDNNKNWQVVASDADGSNLLAAVSGGRLYTSADSGLNWVERQPAGDSDANWKSVSSNSDGVSLFAAVNNGRLYTGLGSSPDLPIATPAPMSYNSTQNVTLGAAYSTSILFTVDGSTPTCFIGTVYSGPISISVSQTVKAIACDGSGHYSDVASFSYIIDTTPPGAVVASPAAAAYNLIQNVTLTSTDSFQIRYTVDGSTPTCSSGSIYSEPINVASTQTIKAVACDQAGNYSEASFYYVILLTNDPQTLITWTERQPAGNVNQAWQTVATDATGLHLLAAVDNGRLYTSADGGLNWTERQPAGNANRYWTSVASNANGSKLLASLSDDRIYISSDYGENWIEKKPAGNNISVSWKSVASDAAGTNLIAGQSGGSPALYISNDGGGTWTEKIIATGYVTGNWTSVASDADGSNLIAADGDVYFSTDHGENWTKKQPAGPTILSFLHVSSNSTGSRLFAAAYGNRLYSSSDYGENWVEKRPIGNANKDWYLFPSDDSGSNLIAGIYTGRLYSSYDGGANWVETQPAGDSDKNWAAVATDANGSNYIAVAKNGRLYVGVKEFVLQTPVASPPAGTYNSIQNITLSSPNATQIRYVINSENSSLVPFCSYGLVYSTPIVVSSSETIKAIACDALGNYTEIASFVYSFPTAQVVLPSSTGEGGSSLSVPMSGSSSMGEVSSSGTNILGYTDSSVSFKAIVSTTGETQNHNLKILSVDLLDGTITLQIESEPQVVKLKLSDLAKVDLDNDKVPDISVKFTNLYLNRAELTVKPLVEKKISLAKETTITPPVLTLTTNKTKSTVLKPYIFKVNLKFGQSHKDIKELQKYLNAKGFFIFQTANRSLGKETSYFGSNTKAALVKFQKAKKISPAAGIFDSSTRKVVNGQ